MSGILRPMEQLTWLDVLAANMAAVLWLYGILAAKNWLKTGHSFRLDLAWCDAAPPPGPHRLCRALLEEPLGRLALQERLDEGKQQVHLRADRRCDVVGSTAGWPGSAQRSPVHEIPARVNYARAHSRPVRAS